MAFAASLIRREASGVFIRELYSFTELGTDTGGAFGTGLATILGVLVTPNGSFAISATKSGSTVTIANAAGPTGGTVEVIGY